MHRGVYVLGLSVFALGTTEFMISGLLPGMARELHVSVPQVGGLISAFAIGMLVGAPLLAVLTLRWPRKATLVGALVVFIGGQLLGAVAPDYAVLLLARVITAGATGAFWAVGGVMAVTLGGKEHRARALAIMVGGLTVANVLGVPLGTVIGDHGGWRGAFFAVAAAALVGLLGILRWVPSMEGTRAKPDLAAELRVFRQPRIWVALATTALTSASIFGTFSYLAPLLTDVAGFADGAVPLLLGAFGVGAVIGLQVAGRLADRYPWASLLVPFAALTVVLVTLALAGARPVLVIIAVVLFGLTGFGTNPALNARVFGLAGDAPTLANSVQVAAFNLGNTVGPLIGGAAIGAGLGFASVPALSAVVVVLAVLATAVSIRMDRVRQPVAETVTRAYASAPEKTLRP
ncbi:DHA1 family chloramphenicol resistance protein-like MFS transporter [Labedaea rhizosphaerae]|uniref:DHA1 family chloramphenicol resistance protein-like MFS transporter n=1 Tax=Labedaea rhizosphaerae TaxID=598644 RepID=A0A4R6SL21_LABRH|nr:DHA1 family chloramphenicol resistance protein-like MFS transporter [Labedaea rhizosphaerae]